jgi:hypothetical protein
MNDPRGVLEEFASAAGAAKWMPHGTWSTFQRSGARARKKPGPHKGYRFNRVKTRTPEQIRMAARQRAAAKQAAMTPEEKRLAKKLKREREDEEIRAKRDALIRDVLTRPHPTIPPVGSK